ncbi:RYamide receptor-like [Nematostella vectensis]|uniref:RYamide receptor-like n=1 Tax=Nematostella vectensis TaxID=45351 RepID=UPI0013905EB1|nr:RYamide receptor-like [Nematostella vectensis]
MNLNSTNGSAPDLEVPTEPDGSFVLRYFIYAIIVFVSLVGNLSVCYVTYKENRMRSFAYVLIGNLAASDVLATLCLPFILVYLYNGKWTFGTAMCKLLNPTVTVFAIVTTNTLVAIACDRYRAVVFPFKVRPSTSETRMIIGLIWLMALLFTLPSYGSRMVTPHGLCIEVFTTEPTLQTSLRRSYSIFMFLVNNLIPLLVILGLHTKITLTLKNISLLPQSFQLTRTSSLAGRDVPSRSSRDSVMLKNANAAGAQKRQQMERKFIRMLLVVVILFVICYMPYQVIFLIVEYKPSVFDNSPEVMYYLFSYSHLMVWLPCALNPVIYAALNERYARSFTRLFCRTFKNLKSFNAHAEPSYNNVNQTSALTSRRKSSCSLPNGPNRVINGSSRKRGGNNNSSLV